MLKPSIDELIEKVGNRYALCIVAAKRARNIINGEDDSIDFNIDKPLSIAIDEIMSDEVKVHIPEAPQDRI
ncbi:MAG: DNA-directed RNA polymerase subunit omega [Firmicutes bacterium]|nr:DNA-directed RNA polymerase subunit omega [Bacillota bacterium]